MIASLIENMLDEGDGHLDLKRNDLAGQLGCVPSQINYVITSRFTPERGYVIESRRGEGGYIRIIRKKMEKSDYIMHTFHAIGNSIDIKSARALIENLRDSESVSEREANIMNAALSETTGDAERANIFRRMLLAAI